MIDHYSNDVATAAFLAGGEGAVYDDRPTREEAEQDMIEPSDGTTTCPACGWLHEREYVPECDRCGETPASVEAMRRES